MRKAAPAILAGLFLIGGCSDITDAQPEVPVFVPTTEEGFTDEWHTADWPSAGSVEDHGRGEDGRDGDDGIASSTPATSMPTTSDSNESDRVISEAEPGDTQNPDIGASEEETPEVLAFDDTGAEFCDAVYQMREVLQWSNATFTEESSGAVDEMVENFKNAVTAAQSRDNELVMAVETASEKAPSIASDLAAIRDRHFWVMSEFEEIGRTAGDGFEVNTRGLDVFDSPEGIDWAARLEFATSNVDGVYKPACGASFEDAVG